MLFGEIWKLLDLECSVFCIGKCFRDDEKECNVKYTFLMVNFKRCDKNNSDFIQKCLILQFKMVVTKLAKYPTWNNIWNFSAQQKNKSFFCSGYFLQLTFASAFVSLKAFFVFPQPLPTSFTLSLIWLFSSRFVCKEQRNAYFIIELKIYILY